MVVKFRRRIEQGQRFRVTGVPYASYKAIGDSLGDQPIRLTFDRGALEFMTTSFDHEKNKSLLSRLVDTLTEELEMDMVSGGNMTFQGEDLDRGMEPDDCFWIKHEKRMRGKRTFNIKVDPPPDVVLEIEISRSLLDRLGILAAIRVPEVWRYDGTAVRILLLGKDGQYAPSSRSLAFPFLPIKELTRFLGMESTKSHTAIIREFRQSVPRTDRQRLERERARKGEANLTRPLNAVIEIIVKARNEAESCEDD